MREILFRGKSLVTSNWVYGNYIIDKWGDDNNKTIYGILTDRTAPDSLQNWIPVRVNPDTIGQYTGLQDKNGKKIFEGDIVKSFLIFHYDKPENDKRYEIIRYVKWMYNRFYPFANDEEYGEWCEELTKNCEVIGNIYDNPEIAEVEV